MPQPAPRPGRPGALSSDDVKVTFVVPCPSPEPGPILGVQLTDIRRTLGKTLPDVDPLGYQPDHAIYEVLSDVGAVVEPESWGSRSSQDPSADFYVVTFEGETERR
jgi:hypothetical protein